MPDTGLLSKIEAAFPGKILEHHSLHGYDVIVLNRDDALAVFATLRDHPEFAFNLLSDLTAADFLGQEPRFEVVYQLYSIPLNQRLQVKIRVPEDDAWAPRSPPCGKVATGLNGKSGTCLGLRLLVIPICDGF